MFDSYYIACKLYVPQVNVAEGSGQVQRPGCKQKRVEREGIAMPEMDRRAFVGAATVGSLAATVLAATSAEAAGQSGYFVIAEIVSKKDKADELRALLV